LPASLLAGLPLMAAVPFGPGWNTSPRGIVPCSLITGAGNPVELIEYLRQRPTRNVIEEGAVRAGGWFTVSVSVWLALNPDPFCAEM